MDTINQSQSLSKAKNALLVYFLFKTLGWIWFKILLIIRQFRLFGIKGASQKFYKQSFQSLIILVRKTVPSAQRMVQKEIDDSVAQIHKGMLSKDESIYKVLPKQGITAEKVVQELDRYKKLEHVEWNLGRVSGTIYHGGELVTKLMTEAFSRFALSNPLHPEIFPSIRNMESEIISMVLKMYNGNKDSCGSVTSGGSESIIMSIKAHRDWARETKCISQPEIVLPVSAHAAFDKGAHYFDIKLVHVPVLEGGEVDVEKMAAAITPNTILLVGSTPSFPHGAIDDIPAIAKLAKMHNIGLHIDSCLGGFLVPFMQDAGYKLPFETDFRVDGVTAISCDTHKYGFAPKGSSVIMYNSTKLRKYQYFQQMDWPGGVYGSPTMAGSRPGALSAGCWAAMLHFGQSGYVESTKAIIQCARKIKQGILEIDGLKIIGDPLLSVVAFKSSTKISIYSVGDLLTKKGYHLNILQYPASIHIACTMLTVDYAQDLINDLKEIMTTLAFSTESTGGDTAKIYGTAASVPDRTIIKEVVNGFLDGLTKI